MKTRLSNLIALVAGLTGMLLSNGCGHSSPPPRTTRIITPAAVVIHVPAEPRMVVTTTSPVPQSAPAPQPAVTTPVPLPTQQLAVQSAPSPVAHSIGGQQPIEDTFNSATAQVLKMYESGVSEDVINSYASVSSEPFNLTTDHIIYFTDIGITDAVIKNMIQHDQALGVATPDLTPPEPNYATQSNSMAPANQPSAPVYAQGPPSSQAVVTPVSTTQTVIVQERPVATTQVFYDSLSPYGTWIYLDDLGWTWQPTVATVNVNWRPYYDQGRWDYTDAGWYWNSSYSWGWAPFHYGRWSRRAGYGWVWAPGSTWAPSWVSWRYSDSYCGWAPLPPHSNYHSGIGFTYHGSKVSVGFGFGLGHSHYSFVNRHHFGRRHHSQHNDRVASNRTEQVYNDSTVINNYIVGDNNTIINEGISRDRVNRGTESEVRRVALADVADSGQAADSRRNGNTGEAISVYRPKVADNKARPTERQLARQETRATRKKIEERTGRSLNQEPIRRMTPGASSGNTLAARTAASSGRIAPNRSSRSLTTSGLKKQDTSSTKDSGRLTALSSRGTPSSDRTRARQTPQRPAATASSSKGSSSRTSGLTKSSVPSSNPRTAARNEINANRAIASRSRLENRANQNTTVSSRSRASQIPTRPRTTPKASTSASNLAKRSTPTTTNNRVTPTYQGPRKRSTTPAPAPRGRVQSTQRNASPSNTRARTLTQPTRVNPPATPNYRTQNRNEVNTRRPSPSYNTNARARMSRQNTPQRQTITPRSAPSTQSYQRRSVPTPTQRTQPRYQAPQRRAPAPAPSRRTTSPSARRQTSPSAARAYSRPTPTYNRPAPSRSTTSPSRSAPSRSSSPSASRSTPQRSRGVPKR